MLAFTPANSLILAAELVEIDAILTITVLLVQIAIFFSFEVFSVFLWIF